MSVDLKTRAEPDPIGLTPVVPVFVAVLTGIGIYILAPSQMVALAGLAIVPFAFIVSRVSTVKRVLLAIVLIEMPIQLDVYIGHDPLEAARESLSGFNLSLTTIALVGLYAIWVTEALAGRGGRTRFVLKAATPALVYAAVVLASVLVAAEPRFVYYEFVIVIQAVMILIYIAHAAQTRSDLMYISLLLLAGVLLQVGFAALAFASGSSVDIGIVTSGRIGGRLAGTIGHPNSLGGYLAMLLPLALATAIAPTPRLLRFIALTAFVSGTVLLGASGSRGGFLGFMTAMALFAVIVWRRELVSRRVFLRALSLAMVPLVIQLGLIASRLVALDNDAATGRLPLIALAIQIIGDNTLWGVGANNFASVLDQYLTIDFSEAWISTVHNRYLLVWAETGIVGLLALLWFLVSAIRRGFRLTRLNDRFHALTALGLLGGVSAAMVHMVVELYHSRPLVQMLWLLAGFLIAVEASGVRSSLWVRPSPRG